MMHILHPMLAENSLFKSIGQIFHPLFELFGLVLAGIYAVVPNYALAIFGLTVLIMLALTPITVKSSKSMMAMQRLQPEMKKLQAKYKGAENRELLNTEMMKLYKENGTSPFGACLPSLLQMPFLIVLYSLIRGLSFGVLYKTGHLVGQVKTATPRYIPKGSQIYKNLVANKGQMHSWFGTDLSSSPFTHHGANQALLTIPYLVLICLAIFLQYYQMKQMNSRNPQAAAANPQMQQMQKFFPIIFGLIYLRVPAGATIYMVVSSAMRIGTQDIMYRTGMLTPVGATAEREIAPGSKPTDKASDKASQAPKALGTGTTKPANKGGAGTNGKTPAAGKTPIAGKPAVTGKTAAGNKSPTASKPTVNGKNPTNNKSAPNGKTPAAGRPGANGKKAVSSDAEIELAQMPKEHPRSRSKRTRKAR
jgi:YidC/Oxa1 family membrane protein insertase